MTRRPAAVSLRPWSPWGCRTGLLAAIGCLMLATTACAPSGTPDETQPTSATPASPSGDTTGAGSSAAATVGDAFEFADGTTIGILAEPWNTTDRIDGQLLHQLPVEPGDGRRRRGLGRPHHLRARRGIRPRRDRGGASADGSGGVDAVASRPQILDRARSRSTASRHADRCPRGDADQLACGRGHAVRVGRRGTRRADSPRGCVARGAGQRLPMDAAFAEQPAAGDPFDVLLHSVDLPS